MKITEVEVKVSPPQLQSVEQFKDCRGVVNSEDVEDGEVGPDLRQRLRLVVLSDPLGWLRGSVRLVVSRDLDELAILLVTVIHTVSLVVTPDLSLSTTAGLRHNFSDIVYKKKSGLSSPQCKNLPEFGVNAVTVVTAELPRLVVVETQQQLDFPGCPILALSQVTAVESPVPGGESNTGDQRSDLKH